ncbi:hypothetical protein [Pragia fontium]|uniref:hypothetical protein n=1 Tax=Pragia fontium TaxID=82985 RepID=UPI000649BB45|nr:hypothetical protein [Pragia fontium]AKJ41543.1 hypothetical protein QQ39_05155 [Pragia fontium]
MKEKRIQLARLYKRGEFFGYGVAVDGELISNQVSTSIDTLPGETPKLKVCFYLKADEVENTIQINFVK